MGPTNKDQSNLEFTSGELSLDTLLRGMEGVCGQKRLNEELKSISIGENIINTKAFYLFTTWVFENADSDFMAWMNRIKRLKPDQQIIEAKKYFEKLAEIKKFKNKDYERAFNFVKENADLAKLFKTMKASLPKKNYVTFFQNFFWRCQIAGSKYDELDKKTFENKELCVREQTKNTTYEKLYYILNQLKANNPVGSVYHIGTIYSGSPAGALHQSVIIGNKMKNGECHLLIQNSYGERCDFYKSECEYSHDKRPIGFWISSNIFLNGTKSIYYIEDKEFSCDLNE